MSEWLERTCPECGKSFVTLLSHKRYCSKECGHKYRNKRRYKRKVQQPKRCERCGKEFVPRRKSMRFCCHECQWAEYLDHNPYDLEAVRKRARDRRKEDDEAARMAVSALSDVQVAELRWLMSTNRGEAKVLRMWLESEDSDSQELKRIREMMR